MHFAYPQRKNSHPPPFRPRSSKVPLLRPSRLKTLALVVLALVGGFWLLLGSGGSGAYHERRPSGQPSVVIVTVLNSAKYGSTYLKSVQENREQYAAKHGYETFIVDAHDYDTKDAPISWAKIMAMRHALTKYPEAGFIWYLDQNAYIMNPSKTVESQMLEPKILESLMIKDHPIVPPDSIIKTFQHLRGKDAALIISQDKDGLVSDSMFIRNGDWARFFTETWFSPLYRSYNFQKAERHALEHMVQWHPTILSKIALIPQRKLASYTRHNLGEVYGDDDFVVVFSGCTSKGEHSCQKESKQWSEKWRASFAGS